MPRKAKGIHTSPEKAGIQNMPENYAETQIDELKTMSKVLPMLEHKRHLLDTYKGKWTDELLEDEIDNYFQYCGEYELKPCKAGLRVWLGISSSQQFDWATKPEKYGRKSDLIRGAYDIMEITYVERGEKYPTMNMFLLKSSHGHAEAQTINVVSTGTKPEEVADMVKNLGLDK